MFNRLFIRIAAAVALIVASHRSTPAAPPPAGAPPPADPRTFANFETAPVHPIDLSPDGSRLAVCNLPDGKLEVFDVTGASTVALGSVPVGLDPVTVRFRGPDEAWVVNALSDSISIVDIPTLRVVATIDTLETPADVVFAGTPVRAFVSCARPNTIQVFAASSREWQANLVLDVERPKSLAVSPDGRRVYAAVFESGNGTTLVGGTLKNRLFIDNVVGLTNSPSGGVNPAPNAGNAFSPPLNPALALATNLPAPGSGLIVRKNAAGRWLDDASRDWTEYVSGTNAHLTQRVPGWDLPDRDLAVIDTGTLAVSYVSGLMNICMATAVNPVSGRIAVVGSDARNEVRFEPNLNGTFVQMKLALIDLTNDTGTAGATTVTRDLNPHLDYSAPRTDAAIRDRSVGDPRAIVWSADGTRAFVAGRGSRNVIAVDAAGDRIGSAPIEVGDGPCGLALDDTRGRLYVYNRFSSSLSIVDVGDGNDGSAAAGVVRGTVSLYDPTPIETAAGRRHLYDTRRTSGLGQASCAACHVDARLDRLAWDLGNPAGDLSVGVLNEDGVRVTNTFHPMKGAMLTQTLQDIIGHEPFHWRGDRPDLESFNAAFTNLQGAASSLAPGEMRELRDFLAGIRLPPNRLRPIDNSLPTNLPLPGHVTASGVPLPNGNALAGVAAFNSADNFCNTCHSLPTGLGNDPFPPGTNGARHFPVKVRLEGSLRSKNAQFRNLADRIGMNTARASSRAGFGFGHDGSVDSLTRFLNGLRVVDNQEIADLIALLLTVSGSDLRTPGGAEDATPPAAAGRQLTLASAEVTARPALFNSMMSLARSPTSRVELIAKGRVNGRPRGWVFDRDTDRFQSDRLGETATVEQLLATAGPGSEVTVTVVCQGTGRRLGIDRDQDGVLDGDEAEAGTNPGDRQLLPRVLAERNDVPIGLPFALEAVVPPLPGPGTLLWLKDGQTLDGETNRILRLNGAAAGSAGNYAVRVITAFETLTSRPLPIRVVPLVVTISPGAQSVRHQSNAVFTTAALGTAPTEYQWQFEGRDIAGATGSSLVVSNVQLANEGSYRVIAANAFGAITSAPAWLGVLIPPSLVLPPVAQSVPEGGRAIFSFQISGHPPPFGYQLRRSTTLLTNYVSADRNGFFTLETVSAAAAGTYRILVTNAANPTGLTVGPANLSVLADFDRDGLPDAWETARGLNTNDASDARLDLDLDGLDTAAEFLAGTDPLQFESRLRLEIVPDSGGGARLGFEAISNRTYAVQTRDNVDIGAWRNLVETVAVSTNRSIVLPWTNAIPGVAERYFRLRTPYP